MRICVYGAGAIGSWLGARLHKAGFQTTLIARGPHLAKLQESGLTITEAGVTENLAIPASLDGSELPQQDLIFVTLKAHSIPQVVPQIKHLMHPETVVITAVNGVPWWFFYELGPEYPSQPIISVDPAAELWNTITPQRTIGCVIYPAVRLAAPGDVIHLTDNRLPIGEPNGLQTARVTNIAEVLEQAGCRAPVRKNIRNEIWIKLAGNLAFNPLSVITNETLDRLATLPEYTKIASAIMEDFRTIGRFYGVRLGVSIARRIEGAAQVGPHKTSMLQDYLSGRPLETAAIVDAVIELAEKAAIAVPAIRKIRQRLMDKVDGADAKDAAS